MSHVLMKWSRNWADEFDTDGFMVVSKEYYELFKAAFLSVKDESCNFGFGTNEGWEDDTFGEIWTSISVTDITDEEAEIVKKLFGKYHGIIPDADIFEYLEDYNIETTDEIEALFKHTESNGN